VYILVSLDPGDLSVPSVSVHNITVDRWLSISTTKNHVTNGKLHFGGEHVFLKGVISVSFNFTDESNVAKRFALQTSHYALQWYETLDGYGKIDGDSLSVY
jgi:endonuclease V-like protein UPF0215 family